MKNIYTILLALLPIIGLNAQTIKVTFEDEELTNGDTVKVETTAEEEVKSYFYLTNMTASPIEARSHYSKIQTNEDDVILMCFGECTIDSVSPFVPLAPGEEFTNFDIAYTPASDNPALIKVSLQQKNGEDTVTMISFFVKYHNPYMSLPTQSKNQPLGIDVYPNPMVNTAAVSYYIPSKYTNPQMVIRNMVGKTLKTYSLKSGVQTKLNISSSDLSNGVYFYSIISDGQTLTTKKLVIRK